MSICKGKKPKGSQASKPSKKYILFFHNGEDSNLILGGPIELDDSEKAQLLEEVELYNIYIEMLGHGEAPKKSYDSRAVKRAYMEENVYLLHDFDFNLVDQDSDLFQNVLDYGEHLTIPQIRELFTRKHDNEGDFFLGFNILPATGDFIVKALHEEYKPDSRGYEEAKLSYAKNAKTIL